MASTSPTPLQSAWTYSKLALGIVLVVLLTMFVIQNAGAIHVEYLAWEMEVSLALVVLVTLLSGVVIGVGLGSWQRWRSTHKKLAAGQQQTNAR